MRPGSARGVRQIDGAAAGERHEAAPLVGRRLGARADPVRPAVALAVDVDDAVAGVGRDLAVGRDLRRARAAGRRDPRRLAGLQVAAVDRPSRHVGQVEAAAVQGHLAGRARGGDAGQLAGGELAQEHVGVAVAVARDEVGGGGDERHAARLDGDLAAAVGVVVAVEARAPRVPVGRPARPLEARMILPLRHCVVALRLNGRLRTTRNTFRCAPDPATMSVAADVNAA